MSLKRIAGILFIVGSILVNIPYAMLISNFDYPDILREGADVILTRFAAGGSQLVFTWLAFALAGLPLLVAVIMLHRIWSGKGGVLLDIATVFGIVALVVQLVGLLRWVYVVPVLAQAYVAADATDAVRAASILSFQTIHQFAGVLLGEAIGQLFTCFWMALIGIVIIRTSVVSKWIGWVGIIAALIYFLAQTELLHTTMPNVASIDWAGLVGSILWILFMVILGVALVLKREPSPVAAKP